MDPIAKKEIYLRRRSVYAKPVKPYKNFKNWRIYEWTLAILWMETFKFVIVLN